MRTVKLYTADGRFVADVAIPAFQTPPEVITWGTRVFLLRLDDQYREAFAVHAIGGARG